MNEKVRPKMLMYGNVVRLSAFFSFNSLTFAIS